MFGAHAAVGIMAGADDGVTNLALGIFAADVVGFFLRFPFIAPVGAVAAFGAAVLGFLGFVAHQR